MKKRSLFGQILLLIVIALVCLFLTVGIAFFAGSLSVDLFDFRNLRWSNMIPIFLIGGFLSCVVVGISVLFIGRNAFIKAKHFLENINEENGGTKK